MSINLKNAIFNSIDANQDGAIDQAEFKSFLGNAGVANVGISAVNGGLYNLGYGGYSGYSGYGGYSGLNAGFYGYDSSAAAAAAAAAAGAGASYAVSGGQYYDAAAAAAASAGGFGYSAAVHNYAADANGNFIDSNPEIIRRPAAAGVQTYTQNVAVRFLQPPPVPPPGPIVIKEVRPPQPPPPAPLRLRQQAPPLPTPPPLVLRERPPVPPPVIPSQTVIRRLAAIPVPPRSVVIERLPPLPPKPRDIFLERWLPYGPQPPRRTLLQRAPPAVQYPRPRNVIVQYDPVQARVVRQVHRLGVTPANPSAYVSTYGGTLLDSVTLVGQARAAGVLEDISAPGVAYGFNAATYGQNLGGFASVADFEGAGWAGAGAGWGGAGWSGAGWNGLGWGGASYSLGGDAVVGWNGLAGATASMYESGLYGGASGYGLVSGGWYDGGVTGETIVE